MSLEIKSKLKETNVTLDKAYDDANMRQADQGEKTKGGYIEINFIDAKAIKEAEANEIVLEVENEIIEDSPTASEESDAIPLGNLPKLLIIYFLTNF